MATSDDEDNDDGTPNGYQDGERSLKEEESRVRSKLANERTFSAWTRTATALIAVGLAVAQFLAQEGVRATIFLVFGTGYVLAGTSIIVYAIFEYRQNHYQMKRAAYSAPKKLLYILAGGLCLLSLLVLGVIGYGVMFG